MNLVIDNENMQEVIRGAIFEALGKKGREAVVSDAIKHLTTPVEDPSVYGGEREPPIQRLFKDTTNKVLQEMLAEELQNSPSFQKLVKSVIDDAIKLWTKDLHDSAVKRISDNIYEKVTGNRYA